MLDEEEQGLWKEALDAIRARQDQQRWLEYGGGRPDSAPALLTTVAHHCGLHLTWSGTTRRSPIRSSSGSSLLRHSSCICSDFCSSHSVSN